MPTIAPYLNFNGNCEEVFNFYKSVFGGEFTTLMRFGEVPSQKEKPSEGNMEDNLIMHVALPVGNGGAVLMGSDIPATMSRGIMGNSFAIAVNMDSKEDADKIFKGLSAGGMVTMPMQKTFWGAYFGMLTDKFDVQWMVSHNTNQ